VRRVLGRLGLVLLGTFFCLILLEVGLRVASTFVGDVRGGAAGEATTILCVGDSHTYGLHVLPPESYPSRLQAALDPTAEEVGVLNYGVPGRNSAALALELPRYLVEVRPDVVLIKVGFNDSWNHDALTSAGADEGSTRPDLRILRLWRLVRMQLEGREPPAPPDLIERDGELLVVEDGRIVPAALGGSAFGTKKGDALAAQVADRLERLVAMTRDAGATPVLLTYATANQPVFVTLNENARRTAARLDVLLIDLAAALRPSIDERGYATLFFPDDHPTAPGNALVADAVAARLIDADLVSRRANLAPTTTDETAEATEARLTIAGTDEDGVQFLVEGTADRDWQIVLSPVLEPSIEVLGTTIPIGAHALVARSLESQNLRGRTDGSGRATCRLSRAFVAEFAGAELYAVAAIFPRAAGPESPPALSTRVTIAP